jgi:peptidoglycan/LPS O-acetylase OafA/YrhL
MNRSGRILELDILRAVAVLMVVGRHGGMPLESDGHPLVIMPFKVWFSIGWTGVDFFFVLSGFLVSGLIFREFQQHGSFQALRFLVRRGFKIYPAFYFFIFLSSLINIFILQNFELSKDALLGINYPSFATILAELLYVQNYFPGLWGHTWTLAVEEHFYLLLAGLSFILIKRNPDSNPFKSLPLLVSVLGVCLLLWRLYLTHLTDAQVSDIYRPSHLRIDSLFFGVLISYWYHFSYQAFSSWVRKNYRMIRIFSVLMLVPCMLPQLTNARFLNSIQLTFLYLGYGGLLVLALFWEGKGKEKWLSRLKGMAFVGKHSYSIYLWHLAVAFWLGPLLGIKLSYFSYLFCYSVLSIFLGVFFSVLLEQKFLTIRDRYFPSRAQTFSLK